MRVRSTARRCGTSFALATHHRDIAGLIGDFLIGKIACLAGSWWLGDGCIMEIVVFEKQAQATMTAAVADASAAVFAHCRDGDAACGA